MVGDGKELYCMSQVHNIAVIAGDGTGPEVVREARKVLEAVGVTTGVRCEFTEYDVGGDRYLRTGEVLPEVVLDDLKKHRAILLGAVGHPEVAPGVLEKGLLLRHPIRIGSVHQPKAG